MEKKLSSNDSQSSNYSGQKYTRTALMMLMNTEMRSWTDDAPEPSPRIDDTRAILQWAHKAHV